MALNSREKAKEKKWRGICGPKHLSTTDVISSQPTIAIGQPISNCHSKTGVDSAIVYWMAMMTNRIGASISIHCNLVCQGITFSLVKDRHARNNTSTTAQDSSFTTTDCITFSKTRVETSHFKSTLRHLQLQKPIENILKEVETTRKQNTAFLHAISLSSRRWEPFKVSSFWPLHPTWQRFYK